MVLIKRTALLVGLPVVSLAIWWLASAGSTDPYFPSLQKILAAFGPTWFEGGSGARILVDGVPSLLRLLTGFLLAVVIGVLGGVAIGLTTRVRAFFEPTLELMRAIPGPVLVPIISLFAGIGDGMKVAVIVTGCLWPILLNTVEGVRGVDPVMKETARSYHMRGLFRIRHLIIPAALPPIFAGMRQGLSVGIILMVISEMFAASNGLGFSVVQFQRNFAIPQMWTGILVLGLLGVAMSMIYRVIERSTLKWYHGMRESAKES